MSEHTPTPWHRDVSNIVAFIPSPAHYEPGEYSIGECWLPYNNELNQANAEFIVLACNAHDEIVRELEWMATQYDDEQTVGTLANRLYDVSCTAQKLLAALS